jgi:hypothetical protein
VLRLSGFAAGDLVVSVRARTPVDERGRMLRHRLDRRRRPTVGEVKSTVELIDRLIASVGKHPSAHLEAGYWRVQVEDQPVLGYVVRHPDELGDPFAFEVYADARDDRGQRVRIRREESLNSAVAWMMQDGGRIVVFAARQTAVHLAETVGGPAGSCNVE